MFLLTLTNESDITIKSIKTCNMFNAITTLVASSTLSDVVEARYSRVDASDVVVVVI